MNGTSTENHPTMNGSAAEDHFAMNGTVMGDHSTTNGTVTEDHSIMNGTIAGNHPTMNGEDDLADSIQQWAMNLADAAKAYKGASGQQSLLLRSKMTNNAKQIIDAIKEPGETPFEYSVQVGRIQRCLRLVCLRRADGGNGCSAYDDGAQNLRQNSSAGKHILW